MINSGPELRGSSNREGRNPKVVKDETGQNVKNVFGNQSFVIQEWLEAAAITFFVIYNLSLLGGGTVNTPGHDGH